MTLHQLPPPFRRQGQQIASDGDDKAFCDLFNIEQMHAYASQVATSIAAAEHAKCMRIAFDKAHEFIKPLEDVNLNMLSVTRGQERSNGAMAVYEALAKDKP